MRRSVRWRHLAIAVPVTVAIVLAIGWRAGAVRLARPLPTRQLLLEISPQELPAPPVYSATVQGRVAMPDGTPVPNVTVWLSPPGGRPPEQRGYRWIGIDYENPSFSMSTDVHGRFGPTGLPPGTWQVSLHAWGKEAAVMPDITLQPGDTAERSYVLPPVPVLTGKLLASDGITPLPDTDILLVPQECAGDATDPGLNWPFERLVAQTDARGGFILCAEMEGDWSALADLPFSYGHIPLEPTWLSLAPWETLRLRAGDVAVQAPLVIDPTGAVVANCPVFLMTPSAGYGELLAAQSDASGRLHIALPSSTTPPTLGIYVPDRGWAECEVRNGVLPPRIELREGARLAGRVCNPDGSPIGGEELTLASPTSWGSLRDCSGLRTGSNGRFEIGGLPPGLYGVETPWLDDGSSRRLLLPAERHQALVVSDRSNPRRASITHNPVSCTHRLSGRLAVTRGAPLQDAEVYVDVVGNSFDGERMPTGPFSVSGDGTFRAWSKGGPSHFLSVYEAGRLTEVIPFSLAPGSTGNIRVSHTSSRVTIKGHIREDGGERGVADAVVLALPEEHGWDVKGDAQIRLLRSPYLTSLSVNYVPCGSWFPGGVCAATPWVLTSEDGSYGLDVPSTCRYTLVVVTEDGYKGVVSTTEVTAADLEGEIDIPVAPQPRVEPVPPEPRQGTGIAIIRVTYADGRAPAAPVWIVPVRRTSTGASEVMPAHVTRTDRQGQCRIGRLPPGEYAFVAVATQPGGRLSAISRSGGTPVRIEPQGGTAVEIVLEPCATLAGRVASTDGATVRNAWVWVTSNRPELGSEALTEVVPVRRDGTYTVAGLPAGSATAYAMAEGSSSGPNHTSQSVSLSAGQTTQQDVRF